MEDIRKINAELEAYNPELLSRPQVIAANKIDAVYAEDEDPVQRIREAFEPEGIPVFAISAVSGQGVKELLYKVQELLKNFDEKPVIFEKEYVPEIDEGANLPLSLIHI